MNEDFVVVIQNREEIMLCPRVLIKVDNSAQKSCFTHLIRDNRLFLEKGEKEKENKRKKKILRV